MGGTCVAVGSGREHSPIRRAAATSLLGRSAGCYRLRPPGGTGRGLQYQGRREMAASGAEGIVFTDCEFTAGVSAGASASSGGGGASSGHAHAKSRWEVVVAGKRVKT